MVLPFCFKRILEFNARQCLQILSKGHEKWIEAIEQV